MLTLITPHNKEKVEMMMKDPQLSQLSFGSSFLVLLRSLSFVAAVDGAAVIAAIVNAALGPKKENKRKKRKRRWRRNLKRIRWTRWLDSSKT